MNPTRKQKKRVETKNKPLQAAKKEKEMPLTTSKSKPMQLKPKKRGLT